MISAEKEVPPMAQVPSVPLIVNDPYFSLWSPSPVLNGADTCNWTGAVKKITGTLTIDGAAYNFLGKQDGLAPLPQTGLRITPTSSRYVFEAAGIRLGISFTSPLLLTDLELLSRPLGYISFDVRSLDGAEHNLNIELCFDEGHCYDGPDHQECTGRELTLNSGSAAWMGKRKQSPLNHSGDDITIDWGYLYLAVPKDIGTVSYATAAERSSLRASFAFTLGNVPGAVAKSMYLAAAYDDVASIKYFSDICKGYWAKDGKTITGILEEALTAYHTLMNRCDVFDESLLGKARELGGASYAKICALAYRQAIAAHKLIADKAGDPVFISKECFSNGCAATVDVSYPSMPLFLFYAPELVIAMMRPIFFFAQQPVWYYDFAPHDAGRYPYVVGQVYALKNPGGKRRLDNGLTHPDYFSWPASADIYNLDRQMPVEECGNMLIMSAAAAKQTGDISFFMPHLDLLEKWASYLLVHGEDPGEQLCTDDFAGHLAHNINLAAKAIMGIEAWSILLNMAGRSWEAGWYHQRASEMAGRWIERAVRGDHSLLVFDSDDGWSLKYNLIWDKFFKSDFFPETVYRNEIAWYLKKQNQYGVPLDSRKDYTKSDWLLWVASMAESRDDFIKLIEPLARFLGDALDKVPFTDWYDTITGKQCGFQNRTVQGGLFMPLLMDYCRP